MHFIKEKRKTPRKKLKLTDKFQVTMTAEEILALFIASQHVGGDAINTMRGYFSDLETSFSAVIRKHPYFMNACSELTEWRYDDSNPFYSSEFLDKLLATQYFTSNSLQKLAELVEKVNLEQK